MSEETKRTCVIETVCSVHVNTGNNETVKVKKRLELDVEFGSPQEIADKSAKVDLLVCAMAKKCAESIMKETNRKRHGPDGSEIGLWDELEEKGPAEPRDF